MKKQKALSIFLCLCLIVGLLQVAFAAPLDDPTVSITGPSSVTADAGATATYTVSVTDTTNVNAIRLTLKVDSAYFVFNLDEEDDSDGEEYNGENGFMALDLDWEDIGDGYFDGEVVLASTIPASGSVDVFKIKFPLTGLLGTTRVELVLFEMAYAGGWVSFEDGIMVAETKINPASNPNQAATPTASPAGSAVTAGTTVALTTATAGADIYYTTDGSTPTAASTLYSAPIAVDAAMTIKAIAVMTGMDDSDVMEETYTITGGVITDKAATPTASPAGSAVTAGTTVTLTTATAGADIYYTTDGSTPTTASTLYSAPIAVDAAMTIKAIAVMTGMDDSDVMEESYTISGSGGTDKAATPTASPAGSAVTAGTTVTLTTATAGADIYYTTDGSTPTTASDLYTAPIAVNAAMTIKAIAVMTGMDDSDVMEETYTITGGGTTDKVATLIASPPGGAVTAGSTVALSTETAGAAIYYTTDGSDPTAASTPYTGPILVNAAMTIKAIAMVPGMLDSDVITVAFTISDGNGNNGNNKEKLDFGGSGTEPTFKKGTTIDDNETPTAEAIPPFINGYPDGTVRPDGPLSRAELAQIIFNLYYRGGVLPSADYTDVTVGHWAFDAISYCQEVGYMIGYPDGSFGPGRMLTRAELSTVLVRINNIPLSSEYPFPDVEGHWAEEYIGAAYNAGYIEGYPDGTFRANNIVTRAEAVTMICRAENRDVTLYNTDKTFPDLYASFWGYNAMMHAANGYNPAA